MFPISRRKIVPAALLLLLIGVFFAPGCGMRSSQTGSLSSRIIDADGNAVMNAEVFSIFREAEKVYSGADGGFYLSELPAGLNNIVILHPDYLLEERQIEIQSDETTVLETIRLDKSNAPHKISNISVIETTSTSATIRWVTYRSVACNIDYGITRSYGGIFRETRPATEHEAELTGLSPETLYHFRVQYIDESSVSHYSYDYSFKTEPAYTPSAPQSIEILPIKAAQTVDIVWESATATSVVGYNLYRQEKDSDWLLLNSQPLAKTARSYADNTVNAGTFNRYAVVAVNQFVGESEKVISPMVFVPGVVNRSQKIAYLDSPVILNSDLLIAAGVTLEVEAGVVFRIGESDLAASGVDEKRVEIIVSGRLVLNGSEAMPVRFEPLNGGGRRDHWAGIRVLSSDTGVSKFSYVEIGSCSGYAIEVEARRLEMNAVRISYCESGLRLAGIRENLVLDSFSFNEISQIALKLEGCRRVNLSNSAMTGVEQAVVCAAAASEDQMIVENTDIRCLESGISGLAGRSTLKNVLIVCPDGVGVSYENVLHSLENYIDHCTIDAYNGIVIGSGTVSIENNIIVNRYRNGNIGINNLSVLTPDYQFNNVFGFSTRYQSCGGGIGAVSTDPEFIGGNPYNYDLLPQSSLNLQDRYGSEMGRYGVSKL